MLTNFFHFFRLYLHTMEKAMLDICCSLTLALAELSKFSRGQISIYTLSLRERESQAISGWLRFHVQVTKNREITTFIFSVQASAVPLPRSFFYLLVPPQRRHFTLIYICTLLGKIEDRNF
jgi:hypothetical protein